ncbi:transcription elongation factor Spt5 [Saitoella complicata NRRL Y-17804]|uniref:Transcription elongation factor SPT5 n=1 Tax=Saitoella complicata (strain BCRC 22490 / CBS 7301 / JCM 7358 / NBRC 10748 / NRRL Y-17804) TaxID=698492 RepID=A0A0E9NIQ6_SAICN|nr:transcription elongation factor Spt5 [Saitoella complicata NRRL Y-17804]ODQ51230.1 transcription elongation factor Spt5 [Saitoella complicata NRRL Y-17804]GAO49295.1 hypothetical protein G7K_3446-t1 [Saitoella complicata NRRL Y-17804]
MSEKPLSNEFVEDSDDEGVTTAAAPAVDADNNDEHPSTSDKKRARDDDDDEEDEEDDEEDDEDDDDEEDEEDEDGEVGNSRRPRKKARRRVNQFIDMEAEVEDDEDELEDDEDELAREDGFIQEEGHPDDVDNLRADNDRIHRGLDRQRAEEAEMDAHEMAARLKERYGRSARSKYSGDSAIVPQRLLMPDISGPKIWGVRVKLGKEKSIIMTMLRRAKDWERAGTPLTIYSAFERESLGGYVYVEADNVASVLTAVNGILGVYMGKNAKPLLIPLEEMTQLLTVQKKIKELLPGAWVRPKRGPYAGDLARVENISENGLAATLKLVPRINYAKEETTKGPSGREVKVKMTIKNRPPPRLFNEMDAQKGAQHKTFQRRGKNVFQFGSDTFENGYLIKDFPIRALSQDNVDPRLEEITALEQGRDDEQGLDLHQIAQSLRSTEQTQIFSLGDQVEVTNGEARGTVGKVRQVIGDIITIKPADQDLGDIDVPTRSLRKKFVQGDRVKVINGRYKDETGSVIKTYNDQVILYADTSNSEITVFTKDLTIAENSVAPQSAGQYKLQDLVQLDATTVGVITHIERGLVRVLDQNGIKKTLLPQQIPLKIDQRKPVATDSHGSEIRVGDQVKEVDGEGRNGTILHIYRSWVFLTNHEYHENAVFVLRCVKVATINAKGGRPTSDGGAGDKMSRDMKPPPNVAMPSRGGRDRVIGHNVTIAQGPHKGLMGIVKDTTDTQARVELHTGFRIISVTKDKLRIKTQDGRSLTYAEFVGSRGGQRGPPGAFGRGDRGGSAAPRDAPAWARGNATPAWQAAKTPAWQGNGFAGGDGGRTPAWAQGSRTPAWSMADGGRTPAWNASSRTPAYGLNDGGRTPAWNASARTPMHGGATPAWNASARTPAAPWDRPSQERAAPWDQVQTPGAISAPTPGATDAATPWGGDDEEPSYAPASP